ncbi:MAG: hypothetical protein LR015_09605 [Verrucomicrobia bacterium]|nr:hypothetical protein [Verrucomicrobiota bacterium]
MEYFANFHASPVAGTDNILATGVTQQDAQLGMASVHVGITHRTDANIDYVTDAADFIIWNSFRGQSGTHLQTGDFTGNAQTGLADLALLSAALGQVHDYSYHRQSLRYPTLNVPGSGTAPEFFYDSGTGRLTVTTRGSSISAWQIPGPAAVSLPSVSGNWWRSHVVGKQQWVDLNLGGLSGEDILVAVYPTGLDASAFGEVFVGFSNGGATTVPLTITASEPVGPTYSEWASRFFGSAAQDPAQENSLWGKNANPLGDGISNELKYWMGLDPLAELMMPSFACVPGLTVWSISSSLSQRG